MARPTAYRSVTLRTMRVVTQSRKLRSVCYEIRGPVLAEAKRLEDEGHRILKLNIGNPAPFGFEAPEDILVDVIQELPTAQGYSDSKGILSARRAVKQHYELRDFPPRKSGLCGWCAHQALCPEFGGTPPEMPFFELVNVTAPAPA